MADALSLVGEDRLRDLVAGMVDVPSPTGDERPLAEHLAAVMCAAGIDARAQPIDDRQANAVGRIPGGGGPSLLLYAPIDTVTTGAAGEDLPWAGPALRPDMLPRAVHDGPLVSGLGASNPKGHGACVLAAAEALVASGERPPGDVWVGFGAGGMPTNARAGSSRRNTGQGVGCAFLLEQGCFPDAAVIAKPGWTVSWEEVGLAWFRVRVRGTHTYVGSRHKLPYRSAIADAARVALALEEWFPDYAARHTDGLVAPQGVVGHVEGGWERMPAFTPAECRLLVDLRLSPRTSPPDAHRELAAVVAEAGVDAEVEMVLAIPGASTDPGHDVVRRTVAAWEAEAGEPHVDVPALSGATDANILRGRGVPTARVGMPKVPGLDFQAGMNTVDVREMARLTRLLLRVVLG